MAVTIFCIFRTWSFFKQLLDKVGTLFFWIWQPCSLSPPHLPKKKVVGKVAADQHDPALKTFYPSLACLTFSYAVCVFERQSFEPCFTTLKSPLAMYCFFLGVVHKWRHANLDDFDPPPPNATYFRSISNVVTKSLTPPPMAYLFFHLTVFNH